MELIIDCREHKLISQLPKYKTQQFDVGDFHYLDKKTGETILIIERKSYADLASSIQSSRFYEQKHRIKAFNSKFKAYLIEGPYPDKPYGRITSSALDSAVMGLTIRDNLPVIYSNNAKHTAKLLEKIIKKLPDWRDGKSSGDNYEQSSIEVVKKNNLTPDVCYLRQLCQIPGISITIANAIKEHYNNMSELINALILDTKQTKTNLANINLGSRKIGTVLSNRIIEFFPVVTDVTNVTNVTNITDVTEVEVEANNKTKIKPKIIIKKKL